MPDSKHFHLFHFILENCVIFIFNWYVCICTHSYHFHYVFREDCKKHECGLTSLLQQGHSILWAKSQHLLGQDAAA